MATCADCRKRRGTHTTVSGRALCEECYRDHAGFVGAGSAMVAGDDPLGSVATGMATRGWAGAFRGEAAAMRRRREKLARTTGFWRRLWVRIVG